MYLYICISVDLYIDMCVCVFVFMFLNMFNREGLSILLPLDLCLTLDNNH